METWTEYEFTLTVGKTLTLAALAKEKDTPELDVVGNPVVCITALRSPAIVVDLFNVFTGQPAPVDDMTGEDFTNVRYTMEALILDFFQSDPQMTELLTGIIKLEKEARAAMNLAAFEAEQEHIQTILNPTPPPSHGGTSSGTASDAPDSSPGPSPSPNSSEPPKARTEAAGITQPA